MSKLTREEVLNMPAGREMDALVAERVMGLHPCEAWYAANLGAGGGPVSLHSREHCKYDGECYPQSETLPYGGPRHYSEDISAAMEVAEKFSEWQVTKERLDAPYWARVTADSGAEVFGTAPTAPLAICRAALLTTLEDE